MRLVEVAEMAWLVLQDTKTTAVEKIRNISKMIQQAPGCSETWSKMLTVCIDPAYPNEQFLENQCDVGTGAAPPLRCLLQGGCSGDRTLELKKLQTLVNDCRSIHAEHF